MRHAAAIVLAVTLASLPCSATIRSTLTILLEFDRPASQSTLIEMERELGRLLHPAGLDVNVRFRSDVHSGESFDDLLIVTMKGSCDTEQDPMLLDERGPSPLAFAHTVGANILPFTVIVCDAVRRTVEPALWGGQHRDREQLFGRALGRVLAHELFHVLEKTAIHSRSGIFRKSLSGQELIGDSLNFAPSDIERLKRNVEKRPSPVLTGPPTPVPVTSLSTDDGSVTSFR